MAFDSLKGLLTSGRVLAYPTREGKFVLDTDASDHGIGTVLSQLQDGVEKPIEMFLAKIKEDQKDWDLQLPACMMAYRGAVHESTGFRLIS